MNLTDPTGLQPTRITCPSRWWKDVGKDGRLCRKIVLLNNMTIPTPNFSSFQSIFVKTKLLHRSFRVTQVHMIRFAEEAACSSTVLVPIYQTTLLQLRRVRHTSTVATCYSTSLYDWIDWWKCSEVNFLLYIKKWSGFDI